MPAIYIQERKTVITQRDAKFAGKTYKVSILDAICFGQHDARLKLEKWNMNLQEQD